VQYSVSRRKCPYSIEIRRCTLNFVTGTIHYEHGQSQPSVPVHTHVHPVDTLPPTAFPHDRFNTFLHVGLSSGSFLSDIPTKILYASLISPMCATRTAYLIFLVFIFLCRYTNVVPTTNTEHGFQDMNELTVSSFLPVIRPFVSRS
jgi:hypothetical protein